MSTWPSDRQPGPDRDGRHRYGGCRTSQIENLVGGQGNDTFAFPNGVQLGGTLDGGRAAILDISAYTTSRTVVLTRLGTLDGYAGTDTAIPSGFDNIDVLVGGFRVRLAHGSRAEQPLDPE